MPSAVTANQDQEQYAGDAIHQTLGFDFAADDAVSARRDECLGERTLGKQSAQQVGQAEGDEEGVLIRPAPKLLAMTSRGRSRGCGTAGSSADGAKARSRFMAGMVSGMWLTEAACNGRKTPL